MRLVRIEAGRFGKIDGRTLGDLSPQLTVVHGPNEAGKSSLMALVRHVLYGFPTPADIREMPYLSESGKRQGRLVFADADGEWVIERTEGPHGGPVTVHALSGRSRDGLATELTTGVSRLAYRVVLGFGLAEMQQIEDLKGKDDDLIARLYAAGAGLTVSPIDVRAKLEASMSALWAKRASTATLNRAKAERDELRARIRALEAEGDSLRTDSARLEQLERDLGEARSRRTLTRAEAETASRAVADALRSTQEASALAVEADRLERETAAARDEAAARPVDATALAAAEVIDSLTAGVSGFRETLASLSNEQSRLAAAESRVRAALGDAGWSEDRALAAAADAGVGAEIDAHREALAKARGRFEAASENRDRLRSDGDGVGGSAAAPGRPYLVPGIVIAVLGAIGIAGGLAFSQAALTVFASVLLLAGGVLSFLPGSRIPVSGAAASRQSVAAAESEFAAAEGALAKVTATWAAWVNARGLGDGSEEPAAVSVRYQAARAVQAAVGDRAALRDACAREETKVQAFAKRVRDVVPAVLGEDPVSVSPDRVPELVNRAARRIAETRDAAAAAAEASARAGRLALEAAETRERAATTAAAAVSALSVFGPDVERPEQASLLETESGERAEAASEEFDRLSQETTALRTALGAERRDTALSEARLEEETLGERIADGIRDYAVLAVASRLLSMAQERYDRERQPEVVKYAEAAFTGMTNGRYTRIAVPLGKDAIEVFDAASAATSPGKLSRGTAEQLYLALRLGLIEQLGDAGAGLPVLMDDILVDFSPDRLEPAARAIADLATRRQVVFLTCHPATADLLCRVAPDAVRLELQRPV